MQVSCEYTVNQSNQRCNAYPFDSVGFLSKVSPTFLQVVGLLVGPEIPRKPVLAMFGRVAIQDNASLCLLLKTH